MNVGVNTQKGPFIFASLMVPHAHHYAAMHAFMHRYALARKCRSRNLMLLTCLTYILTSSSANFIE